MYVSRGVGATLLPARFACRPELAIITLQPMAN
jgi:predicted MPP superfamily phosphohydrolase